MVHGDQDRLLIDGNARIFFDYVIDGIVDRYLPGNRHLNTISIGNNAVHTKKFDCDVQFFIHDIIRRI